MSRPHPDDLRQTLHRLLSERGPGRTLCPSEVARAHAGGEGDWRALMDQVRAIAAQEAQAGRCRVTQRGREVDALTARGPLRLGLPPG